MTSLTRVELRRIFARRIVHLSVLAVLAVALMTFWGLSQVVKPVSDYEDQARQDFEQVHAQWEQEQEFQDEEGNQQCLDDQEAEREATGDPNLDFGCVWEEPTLEDMMDGYGAPSMVELYEQNLRDTGMVVLLLALLGGSTATAAEISHRTLGTWLTFEPRRDRVFASKVLASALATLPITTVFLGLILAGIPVLFRIKGVDDAVSAAQWTDLGWMSVRLALLAMFLGMVGAAAGLLLKHTGAVLGMAVGYLLVVESMVRGLFPAWSKYLLSENLFAWLGNGRDIVGYVCTTTQGGGQNCEQTITHISLEHGAITLGVVGMAVVLVSWLVFRWRDVN